MMRHCSVVAGLMLAVLLAGPVRADEDGEPQAKVRATFLGEGTYATEEDCRALRTYETTGSYPGETLPRLVTAEGSKVADQACAFSSIAPHGAGYRAELTCKGGCETFTETFGFAPHPQGGFEISTGDSAKTMRLVRCEPAAATQAPTN